MHVSPRNVAVRKIRRPKDFEKDRIIMVRKIRIVVEIFV